MGKKMIFPEDEGAASLQIVKGWVCSKGLFHGNDERAARYSGSTHRRCEDCGDYFLKRSYCNRCHLKKAHEKYLAREFKEWDKMTPVVIPNSDIYFFTLEDFLDNCADEGLDPEDVHLSICEPNIASEIREDHYCDILAEDQNLEDSAPALAGKIAELNEFIKKNKFELSWHEGKFRTNYKK